MPDPRIFVTWPMEPEPRAILEQAGTVETSPVEEELPEAELRHRAATVEAVIPMGSHPVPAAVIEAAPRLRVIAVAAVGYNLIDVAAATRRGILVTNTPGVLTETTADMAWALMLATARRVAEGDRFVRAGRWKGVTWSLMLGRDVQGATLGTTRGGPTPTPRVWTPPTGPRPTSSARRTSSSCPSPHARNPPADRRCRAGPDEAERLPRQRRPGPGRRRGGAGPRSPGAAARRGRDRRLRGRAAGASGARRAGPGRPDAHVGSASRATRLAMATRAAENCVAALAGQRPPNLVNPDAWHPL